MSLALIDGADFQGADLKGAILEDVDMESANFAGAELFVDISSFGDTVATILQEHEKWIKTDGQEGSRADLAGLNMERIALAGKDLSGANLKGAKLAGAKLQNTTRVMTDL